MPGNYLLKIGSTLMILTLPLIIIWNGVERMSSKLDGIQTFSLLYS